MDRIENQLTRVNSFNVIVNGKAISATTLLNKATSYLEFPIVLNLPMNEVKFSVQGNPEAYIQLNQYQLHRSLHLQQ